MKKNTSVSTVTVFKKATVKSPYISIILPTYNEAKNVSKLLEQIHRSLQNVSYEFECVFVDDSKDDTPVIIEREIKKYPGRISFIKRSGKAARSGLTQAFREGFSLARGQILICMDTDLQHPPDLIPKLVKMIDRLQCDIAIASRYTTGGSAEGLNGVFRHIVSRVTNFFVHVALPGTRVTTDPMTGYFAFKRSLLPEVQFSSYGFKILVELLSSLRSPRVVEVPLIFKKRINEESKATIRQGLLAYRDIINLFTEKDRGNLTLRAYIVATLMSVFVVLAILLSTIILNLEFSYLLYLQLSEYVSERVPGLILDWLWVLVIIPVAIFGIKLFRWGLPHTLYRRFNKHAYVQVGLFTASVVLLYLYLETLIDGGIWGAPFILGVSFFLVYLLLRPVWRFEYERYFIPERWFIFLLAIFLISSFQYFISSLVWWESLFMILYLLVMGQGLFALYLMIYAWDQTNFKNNDLQIGQKKFLPPQHSFTVIVPAKHEKNTIADTLHAMNRIKYPTRKKQVLVVIHKDTDDGTIDIVEKTIRELKSKNIQLITYNSPPINKPHGLNKALEFATGDFVVIFDAEDEPHPNLFSFIDTHVQQSPVDVIQSGVQLMNYESNWYSTFNVLEYYFWFKSTLHFYAKQGVVPLGGVSVFFRRSYLEAVGGWDINCLTEDAEIGIRLSRIGAQMSVIYDATYATQEETPPSLVSFVKQRTRWAQGFLQILSCGAYRNFPTYRQRLLALYVLMWPIIIPVVFLLFPLGIIIMLVVKLAPMVALLSNVALLLFLVFVVVQILGLYEFTRDFNRRFPWWRIPLMIVGFYPYTVLLAFASLRAMYRNYFAITVWEKTEHKNTHRQVNLGTSESSIVRRST